MNQRKQPSLDELFQLYPQLRLMAVTKPMSASQMPSLFMGDVADETQPLSAPSSQYGETS